MKSIFTRKSAKDEIKHLLDNAENLYKNNVRAEVRAADSTNLFKELIAKLKSLTETNVDDTDK